MTTNLDERYEEERQVFDAPEILFSRVYARTCFIASTLGDSGARQSARDTRPFFFFSHLRFFLLRRRFLPFTRIRRGHGPTSRWANARSTPGCGADTRSDLVLRYIKICHVLTYLYWLTAGSEYFLRIKFLRSLDDIFVVLWRNEYYWKHEQY